MPDSWETPDELLIGVRMSLGFPQPEPVDFIIPTRFGGLDIPPRNRIFVGPTRTNRKAKRRRCKARRRARLRARRKNSGETVGRTVARLCAERATREGMLLA